MIFSPQTQGKKLPSYATVRDKSIHNIQNSYWQGGQVVTKSLKYMTAMDLNDEYPTRKLSNKTYYNRKAI